MNEFNISAHNLRAEGLAYPLYDFTALWQGTLNEATSDRFTIHAEGEYIVYVTYESK
jgi:thiamine pyrophosphokinase